MPTESQISVRAAGCVFIVIAGTEWGALGLGEKWV